jgi:Flp pilus assembly pilin Flp
MTNLLKGFLLEEQGQDLIEYTLLLAFVCLASAALFISAGTSLQTIWGSGSTTLASAQSAAS